MKTIVENDKCIGCGNCVALTESQVFDFNVPITGDIEMEARFTEIRVQLIETDVVGMVHYLKTRRIYFL